jgi:hypothetical protein
MRKTMQRVHDRNVKRCSVCGGRFGLIRHYSWRTALCSKKCVERFQVREESDRRWLDSLHFGLPERMRASPA